MFSKKKIALSAAIVLGTAFSASAAPTHHATHVNRSTIYDMVSGYSLQTHSDLNSSDPALTGGGSLGYNEALRKNHW